MNTEWINILKDAGYPIDVVVLDFETYFDKDYQIKKMSTIEFVQDPRFEELGVAVLLMEGKYPHAKPICNFWFDPACHLRWLQEKYGEHLERCTVVAHNARFDMSILTYRHNIRPPFVVDTLGLARHVAARKRNDLGRLCNRYDLIGKGDTKEFLGLHRNTMTDAQRKNLAAYAENDAMREWELFTILLPQLTNPKMELRLMQHTLTMFTRPLFTFDFEKADEIKAEMQGVEAEIVGASGFVRKDVSGTNSFERILRDVLGDEEPPMKPGKLKPLVAVARTDAGYEYLLHHEKPEVRALMDAKVAIKTWPKNIKRVDRMINQAKACGGFLAVPLKYHGAHCVTGDHDVLTPEGWVPIGEWGGGQIAQWSSDGKIQFLEAKPNIFEIDESLHIMNAVRAKGRFTGGHHLPYHTKRGNFHQQRAGEHPHMDRLPLAGRLENMPTISYAATRVLVATQADGHWVLDTRSGRCLRFGFRRKRKIRRMRQLLDTLCIPFTVCVEKKGTTRITIAWRNLPTWLTPERKSFGPWLLDCDLNIVLDELVHWDGWLEKNSRGFGYCTADLQSAEWIQIISHLSNRAVSTKIIDRREQHPNWNRIYRLFISPCHTAHIRPHHWRTRRFRGKVYCPTTQTGYWMLRHGGRVQISGNTGRWSGDEKINLQNLTARSPHACINAMRGLLTAPPGYVLVITDAAQIEARNLAWQAEQDDLIEAFAQGRQIYCEFASEVMEKFIRKPLSFDPPEVVAYLKHYRMFGKVGILGCGYGMGAARCLAYARDIYHLEIDLDMATRIVKHYRKKYKKICALWTAVEKAFKYVVRYPHETCAVEPGLTFANVEGTVVLGLPSGRALYYHSPYISKDEKGRDQLCMPDERKIGAEIRMWGGYLVENIIQATSRDILGEAILILENLGYPVALTAHDELIQVVPKEQGDDALATALRTLSQTPIWCPGLPLDAEGRIAERYGKG